MVTHILRRLLLMIPNIVLLTFLLFAGVTVFLGSPASVMLGQEASQEAVRQLNLEYGFDRPVVVQYLDWMGKALQGDFGRSYSTNMSVSSAVLPAMPVTLELAFWAIALAVVLTAVINSLPVGRRVIGSLSSTLSIIGITIPNFMLGISLIYVLSVQLRWLPTTGWVPWSAGVIPHLTHLIMPVLTLSAFYFGSFTLVYRAEYRMVYRQLFIRVARAKGLSETRVSFFHALPNAILPVITYVGLSLGQLLGGAVVTETVFSMPGIGRLFVSSIGTHDFPVMLAIGILIIVGVMLMNLLADILYTIVNPQVRLG
ncbi:peptide/nickel transport system permease protein [Rhodoligotrophos appendicifer]|uniref:ABC transporter permease n=1 Tax=Rhodoligotrophos appendicifer TaxID=987056 RepID=UPI0011847433|nr:ABC transporter permease [Rhodoligotrophos appendicifer]